MDEVDAVVLEQFWKQVRSRRNHYFLWWMGWPVAGIACWVGYRAAWHADAPEWLMLPVLAAWFVVWLLIARRLRSLECPRCHAPAISNPFFLMRNVRCRHCGLRRAAS